MSEKRVEYCYPISIFHVLIYESTITDAFQPTYQNQVFIPKTCLKQPIDR